MSRFIVFFVCWIACVGALAQTNTGPPNTLDAYWNLTSIPSQAQATLKLSTVTIADPVSSLNDVTSYQLGSNNVATLSILSGSQNRIDATQLNNQNSVDAALSGVNNSLIINQTGGGNSLSVGLNGANNRFLLSQDGGDRLQLQGLQQNGARLEISQGAGNNTLTIDNTSLFKNTSGTGIPNLRIEQSGGATAIIQNGLLTGN